jgi:hypothetical protein
MIGRVAVHVRKAIARHGRRVEVNGRGARTTATTGPPCIARFGFASPSYREALPSSAHSRKITRPGTLFDLHVP